MTRSVLLLLVLIGAGGLLAAEDLEFDPACGAVEIESDALSATATGISFGECFDAFDECQYGCAVDCEDHPFPEFCEAVCNYECRVGLGACVGVVIAVGVL